MEFIVMIRTLAVGALAFATGYVVGAHAHAVVVMEEHPSEGAWRFQE